VLFSFFNPFFQEIPPRSNRIPFFWIPLLSFSGLGHSTIERIPETSFCYSSSARYFSFTPLFSPVLVSVDVPFLIESFLPLAPGRATSSVRAISSARREPFPLPNFLDSSGSPIFFYITRPPLVRHFSPRFSGPWPCVSRPFYLSVPPLQCTVARPRCHPFVPFFYAELLRSQLRDIAPSFPLTT